MINQKNMALCVDKYENVHIIWENVENSISILQHVQRIDNVWMHMGTLYRSNNKIVFGKNGFITNPVPTIIFVENGTELHVLSKPSEENDWGHKIFVLDQIAEWVGILEYRSNIDLPICSSSSSSSIYSSSTSSLSSDIDSFNSDICVFVLYENKRLEYYILSDDKDELISKESHTRINISSGEIKNITMSLCGQHVGIAYDRDDKIYYNMMSFSTLQWSFVNFSVFMNSAPEVVPLGYIMDFDICGYDAHSLGYMPIAWLTQDAGGNMVLRGSVINTLRREWPLDLANHAIVAVPKRDMVHKQVSCVSLLHNNMVPQIIVFGASITRLRLIKGGRWDSEPIEIKGWIGHVKNRKTTSCLKNNILHVVFRDDSGLYYFSEQEAQLHKLSN